MIEMDGSQKSGSGTIVRDAVSFSILIKRSLRLKNIRAKRDKPGLRAQHLKGIEASAQICEGQVGGLTIGSKEIIFKPGRLIKGGKFEWNIGTAGSTTMLALNVMPLALFADSPANYRITGGLFQDFAPSAYHLKYVLLTILKKMGASFEIEIIRPGYVPRGEGLIEVNVFPAGGKLKPLNLLNHGKVEEIKGIALSSLLKERMVSERMAEECKKRLKSKGYDSDIEIFYDTIEKPCYKSHSIQKGASLAIWAETDTGCLIGSDMAGALGRSAELIGQRVAKSLIEDLETGATVDRYLADQLIPFAALAEGWSSYRIPRMTEHIEARLWLAEKILGAKNEVKGNLVRIRGIGYQRRE